MFKNSQKKHSKWELSVGKNVLELHYLKLRASLFV